MFFRHIVLIHRTYTRFQCYVHRRHISTIFRHAMETAERPFNCKTGNFPVISGPNDEYMIITDLIGVKKIVDFRFFSINKIIQAILGPWREGAPANRATRLLTHIPLFHATHLTRTVSGLRRLPFERPLSITNKMATQRNYLTSYCSFLHGHGLVLCLRLIYYIELHSPARTWVFFIYWTRL